MCSPAPSCNQMVSDLLGTRWHCETEKSPGFQWNWLLMLAAFPLVSTLSFWCLPTHIGAQAHFCSASTDKAGPALSSGDGVSPGLILTTYKMSITITMGKCLHRVVVKTPETPCSLPPLNPCQMFLLLPRTPFPFLPNLQSCSCFRASFPFPVGS